MKQNLAVIIPALNPDVTLIDYVQKLLSMGFGKIIIVNDGSNPELDAIFHHLNQMERTVVLIHEINRGKGRALKTAFEYCIPISQIDGVITADADGQHHPEDLYEVARLFSKEPEKIILGTRDFSEKHVPKKSHLGNRATSILFYLFFRAKLIDTQTGLRAIPKSQLSSLLALKGERFEYEMNVLIYAVRAKVGIEEVPIRTIYYNNNSGTYYSAVKDSIRILNRIIGSLLKSDSKYKKLNSEIGELDE